MSDWKIRGKPALLILHMQGGIVGESGNIRGSAQAVRKAGIIPRQQALLKAFRDRKLPVIYVNAMHISSEQNPAGALPAFGNLFKIIESTKATPHNLEVISDLAPQPGEPVLINWLLGAFNSSGLDYVLKAKRVETLVLTGYATNMVVYTTTVQAADLWYSVVVARDACTSQQAEAHEAAMTYMFPNLSLVTDTKDVIAHL